MKSFDNVILSLFSYIGQLQLWDWILIHQKQFDSILQMQ